MGHKAGFSFRTDTNRDWQPSTDPGTTLTRDRSIHHWPRLTNGMYTDLTKAVGPVFDDNLTNQLKKMEDRPSTGKNQLLIGEWWRIRWWSSRGKNETPKTSLTHFKLLHHPPPVVKCSHKHVVKFLFVMLPNLCDQHVFTKISSYGI